MTQAIQTGPVFAMAQNVVYALPARSVFIHSGAVVEVSNDSTTGFVSLSSSTTGVQTSATFVRCTTGATTITCKVK